MIKVKIHSVVDVITNSSTTIYTYQDGSVNPAKELINEMLKLAGVNKKADDIFYFGVFCEDCDYLESDNLPDDKPKITEPWNGDRDIRRSQENEELKWLEDLMLSIMKGDIEKPEWMMHVEKDHDYGYDPNSYLTLIPKEDQYKEFANKISALLNSVSADGGFDG